MATRIFLELDREIWKSDYDWLTENQPGYLAGIEHALGRGATPEAIHRHLLRHIGPDRRALALRCFHAAHWIRTLKYEEDQAVVDSGYIKTTMTEGPGGG